MHLPCGIITGKNGSLKFVAAQPNQCKILYCSHSFCCSAAGKSGWPLFTSRCQSFDHSLLTPYHLRSSYASCSSNVSLTRISRARDLFIRQYISTLSAHPHFIILTSSEIKVIVLCDLRMIPQQMKDEYAQRTRRSPFDDFKINRSSACGVLSSKNYSPSLKILWSDFAGAPGRAKTVGFHQPAMSESGRESKEGLWDEGQRLTICA